MKNYDKDLQKLWKNKGKVIIPFIVIIIIINVIIAFLFIDDSNETLVDFNSRFRSIAHSDSFSGSVDSVGCFKGAAVISLTNNDEIVLDNSRNYDYEVFSMCCFISLGDSLIKFSNNDTVFILRDKEQFIFVHGDFIGTEHESRFYGNPCR